MTIAAVLKHHGHHCARSILTNGRLRFDIKSVSSTSVSMPLKSHTFHGGSDHVEGAPSGWWLEPGSMDVECEEMATYFPDFHLIEGTEDAPPAWYGTIHTSLGKYPVLISHRRDHSLPGVTPVNPVHRGRNVGRRFRRSPHLYDNGNLCVALESDWEAGSDTAATVVGWAAHWHAVYQEWFFTGKWATEKYISREVA